MSGRFGLRDALRAAGLVVALSAAPQAADAGILKRSPMATSAVVVDSTVREVRRALEESRLRDAGRLLDEAQLNGLRDPRLVLASGQLSLMRGRYDSAFDAFKAAEASPPIRAGALEGQGIALSLLGRSDEALAVLQQAVAADPSAWRAWSALAGEWDKRRDWSQAEAAYAQAARLSNDTALVLNNRGYSRLLQGRIDESIADLVVALRKDPSLAAARTNLRLGVAMRGEYAEAMAGAAPEGRAAALNNAGFAAMMRGDYERAMDLFQQAIDSKGEYYGRASANLQVARSLRAQTAARTVAR